jgi:hypothetical protein
VVAANAAALHASPALSAKAFLRRPAPDLFVFRDRKNLYRLL